MSRYYDVVYQGAWRMTISVPADFDAHAMACRALGVDDDDGAVEVFEVFE